MEKIYFPPIVQPSYPLVEEPEDTSIISEFEDGSQQSRVAKTRSRNRFTVEWKSLSEKEYHVLMHFIKHVVKFSAKPFIWTHASTYNDEYRYLNPDQQEIEVRITGVGKWENYELTYWRGSLELTEV